MTARTWHVVLVTLGAVQLGLAAWAAADPSSFTEHLADFGAYNAHLVRDFAAASATFGAGLLLAARIRSLRTPILVLAAMWSGLHALSHLADAGHADPHVLGPTEAVTLVAATALLVVLARLSGRPDSEEGR